MALLLNEDETMLAQTAEGFFADKAPVSGLRALRDSRDETGFDKKLWAEMADMGFAGVLVPEAQGGVNMGVMAAGLIAQQMGCNLTASPFLSTAVLAATVLKTSGSLAQKDEWLSKIAGGDAIIALALDEGPKHNPATITTKAERSGNGFKISGSKQAVIDGHVADQIIVCARTSDEQGEASGLSLFLVDPKLAGIEIERTIMVDSRNAARIEFDGAEVTADALIGQLDEGASVLAPALDAGRAVLAAELLGAGSQAFTSTVDYLKERKQFGKIIGEFQALQHRASHLYTEIELTRSAVLGALTAIDAGDENASLYCTMAKAKAGQVAKLAALEGVQMHGGVGMTDEYDIGLYLKRIRTAQELLGDGHYHMNAYALASGF